ADLQRCRRCPGGGASAGGPRRRPPCRRAFLRRGDPRRQLVGARGPRRPHALQDHRRHLPVRARGARGPRQRLNRARHGTARRRAGAAGVRRRSRSAGEGVAEGRSLSRRGVRARRTPSSFDHESRGVMSPIRVTVWGENVHEQRDASVQKIYPDGMHNAIADGIRENLGDKAVVRTATLQEPEHGLTEEVLADTDVLTWWGHAAHHEVSDEVVERVYRAVLGGMGLIALHSAHFSKIFVKLMGTTCSLNWRSEHDRELIWTVAPGHPIARGIPHPLIVPEYEMYGELFDVPQPDE